MLKLFVIIILFLQINRLLSIVYLHPPNDRGPAAAKSAVLCLQKLTSFQFYRPKEPRVKNLVMLHTHQLSSPAAEIEMAYLRWIELTSTTCTDRIRERFQLRIIGDNYRIEKLLHVPVNALQLADFYMLVTDNVDNFRRIMQLYVSRESAWNPAGRFIVLYTNPNVQYDAKIVAQSLLKILFDDYRVANAVIAVARDMFIYDIYRGEPYDENNCGKMTASYVDSCDRGEFGNAYVTNITLRQNIVPPQMHQCNFTICARISPPFVGVGCSRGLEIDIIKVIQSALKINFNLICSDMRRGEPGVVGNWSYLLGMVQNNTCQLLFGSMFPDNDVHFEFGVTNSYLEDSYTWFVPLAPMQARWKGLIHIFQTYTWCLFCVILVCLCVAWYFLGSFTANEESVHKMAAISALNAWATFLGVSANNRPTRLPLRLLFISIALYGLNVTTLYTSNLVAVFTNPVFDDQMDTIEELLGSSLPFGGSDEYKDWFEDTTDEINSDILPRFNISDDFQARNENIQEIEAGNRAILLNRMFVMTSNFRKTVYGFSGNVFTNPLEMIGDRGFPLLNKFTNIINQMKDTGLLEKINRDLKYHVELMFRQSELIDEIEHVPLTIDHIQGAFAVLICGLTMSTAIFLGELIIGTDSKSFYRTISTIVSYLSVRKIRNASDGLHNFNWIPSLGFVNVLKDNIVRFYRKIVAFLQMIRGEW